MDTNGNDFFEQVDAVFNAIAAKLPLIDEQNRELLADVKQDLTLLLESQLLPQAMIKQIKRTMALIQSILDKTTGFENGLHKLKQSVEKLMKGFHAFRDRQSNKLSPKSGVEQEKKESKNTRKDQDNIVTDASMPETDKKEEIQKSGQQLQEEKEPNESDLHIIDNDPDFEGDDSAALQRQEDIEVNDLSDLLLRFASQQAPVLERFESLCLELERNKCDVKPEIKRILHT